jgi:methionyl-tRNA formyltransferase
MRFGFVTCVQLGLSCMEAIYDCGASLELAFTLEDDQARSKSGRVYIDKFCQNHAVPLVKARNINLPDVVSRFEEANLDWLLIIGWSQIARAPLLAAPKRGCLGIHPTLLPIGRGRAAIPWTIIHGLEESGVTLFKLDEGVDTGEILAQQAISLPSDVDASQLYAKIDALHVELIRATIPKLQADEVDLRPQDDSKATYWSGRTPEDGELKPEMTIEVAERLVRAVTRPYPGAYFMRDGQKTVVWKARVCGAGELAGSSQRALGFQGGDLLLEDWT